jgi:hypothetical protein
VRLEILLLHLCLIVYLVLAAGHRWGNFGTLSYRARLSCFQPVLGEKFTDEKYYIRWLKRFYALTLPLVVFIYGSTRFVLRQAQDEACSPREEAANPLSESQAIASTSTSLSVLLVRLLLTIPS